MTEQIPLRQIISNLTKSEDDNDTFLAAAAINLYIESLRRIHGRVLLQPYDVKNILTIFDLLLAEKPISPTKPAGRSHALTEDEEQTILSAVEEKVGTITRRT